MRISDWSSDVCSSDLPKPAPAPRASETDSLMSRQERQAQLLREAEEDRLSALEDARRRDEAARARAIEEEKARAEAREEKAKAPEPAPEPEAPAAAAPAPVEAPAKRSEEHTSELQTLMRTSYDVFCLKNKNTPE